jgi:hypothetical protein
MDTTSSGMVVKCDPSYHFHLNYPNDGTGPASLTFKVGGASPDPDTARMEIKQNTISLCDRDDLAACVMISAICH